MTETAPEVHDNPDLSRWEARLDGELAGFAAYVRDGDTVTFTHTETDPRFEGRGVGSALARAGLDAARTDGAAVVPSCPFIVGWIGKHPEYEDLLA